MNQYQISQLESLYRGAVLLNVNPAGGVAPCQAGCGRIGRDAHHFVRRSQAPGIRWRYEPRWGLWLCGGCHGKWHDDPEYGQVVMECLLTYFPRQARTLERFAGVHDRVKCPQVTFSWMKAYLTRCTDRRRRDWSDAYFCEEVY